MIRRIYERPTIRNRYVGKATKAITYRVGAQSIKGSAKSSSLKNMTAIVLK